MPFGRKSTTFGMKILSFLLQIAMWMQTMSSLKYFCKSWFIGCLLILLPFISISQNAVRGEALEKLWTDNETNWANDFKQATKANQPDFEMFLNYNQSIFYKDRGVFFRLAEEGKMHSVEAAKFFSQLKKKYLPLYKQYLNVKNNFPNTLAEYTQGNRGNNGGLHGQILGICNPACFNIDCSNGTLAGWNAYYAVNQSTQFTQATSALTGGACGAVTRSAFDPNTNTDQVALMSGNGVDPVCGAFIPVVPPMGNYSIRVGDSTGTNLGVAEVTNSFYITGNNPVLTIQYAVILEQAGHLGWEQPWFQMQVLDSNGNPIPGCGQYVVVNNGSLPGFKSFFYPQSFDSVSCKSWTTVFVPLQAYVGHCVTVSFEASDCYAGGHFGYAYVACSCSDLKLASSSPAFCGQTSITLTAPPGAASYTWSGPCISGPNNQQSCYVTCPGTYKVIVVSTAGPTCADTLSINIPSAPGPPPVPFFNTDTVCAGVPTLFTNLTNPLNGNTYYWDFYDNGHIEDSTHVNPLWTFPVGGVYHVKLKAVHNGCGADTTLTVIVDSTYLPSMSVFSFCSGQPTNFDNISQGGGHYIWNFGDPHCPPSQDTSTVQFTTHTYAQPGTYTVSLKVTNTRCPDSAIQVITIDSTPVEHIVMNPIRCGSDTVTFHADDSTNVFEYNWTFYSNNYTNYLGSWFSTTSATKSFVFPSPNGTYQVTLIAYSSNGFCPGYDSLNFTLGVDTPHFSLRPPVACLGRTIVFHDSSSGQAIKWDWNFGDPGSGPSDSSLLQNPTHKFSAPGTYTVKFTTTSASNCVMDTTQTITVNPIAVANFTGDSVCSGDSNNFHNLSTMLGGGAISGLSWNFGDPPSGVNNTSVLQNPAHKFTTSGTYTVSLTAQTSAGCDSTITKIILVYPAPVVKYTASKTCLGATTQFVDGTTIGGGGTLATWQWTFGDGGTSGTPNTQHTYATWGTYNTQLVVISSNGCSDTTKEKITVNPNPVVSFSADSLAGCAPLCVNFTNHSTIVHGNNVKWSWNFGTPADTGSGANPQFCYNNYGFYPVKLVVTSDSGCKSTQTINNMITVYGDPRAIFTPSPLTTDILNPIVNFNNTSNPGQHDSIMYFTWRFSDDSIAYTKNVTRTFADTGTYCATLKVVNGKGCIDSTTQCVYIKPAYTFYIPDAFSPNGDGKNDIFLPRGTYIRTYDMYIFNRWGNLIFHTSDLSTGWDGSISHILCQEDTYVYVIDIIDAIGKGHNYMGKVSLLK